MTSLSFNRAPVSTFENGVSIIGFLQSLLNKLVRHNQNYWAMRTLEGMSDRDLRDIGIFRCEIEGVVKGQIRAGVSFRK